MDSSLTILGSGSGLPQAGRATSGYALSVNGGLTLIDCGGGVTQSFLRCGLEPLDVDTIFISHTHSDHCCELTLFLQLVFLHRRTRPLELYIPEEFVEPFNRYLRAVYLAPQKLGFDLAVTGYKDGFRYESDFSLTAHGNRHLQKVRAFIEELGLPNKMQCHSLLVQTPGKTLLYSSDLAGFDDIKGLLPEADIALVESTHTDVEELLDFAEGNEDKHLILTHIGPPPESTELQTAVEKRALDNVEMAADGMVVAL
jgi:ribonuclease BN (tRNA processing enzyme)